MAHMRYDNHRPDDTTVEQDTFTASDMDSNYETVQIRPAAVPARRSRTQATTPVEIEPAPYPVRRNQDKRPVQPKTATRPRPVQKSQAVTVRYEDNVVEATMQDYDHRQHPSTTAKITAPADAARRLRVRPVVVDGIPVAAQNRAQRRFWTLRNRVLAIMAAGALAALALFVPPQIEHYHSGDYPAHRYIVSIKNEKCDVIATYNSGNIDILIVPQNFKSKLHPSVQVGQWKPGALNNGPTHNVTLITNEDVNADGRTDIQVFVDGQAAGVLFADSDGSGYHWQK